MYSEPEASTQEPSRTLRDVFNPDADAYDPWTDKNRVLEYCAAYDDGIDMYLFTLKVAELHAEWSASLDGTTHHLLEGHSWLVDRITPQTLEQLQAADLITRPTIHLEGQSRPKTQLLRRSYWALGDAAQEFLDMAAFRGLTPAETPSSAGQTDPAVSRTRKGDPNESLSHAVGVAANTAYFAARGYDPTPYQCLDPPHVPAEYTDRPFDVVVWDDAGEIVGQVEVETRVDDYRGLTTDAGKLMAAAGESWWCLPSKQHVNRCLQQLVQHEFLEPGPTDPTFPDDLSLRRTTKRLTNLLDAQKYAQAGQAPPVTGINSFDNIRAKLVEERPEIMYPAENSPTH